MRSFKSVIKSQPQAISPIPQFPIPEIDQARWTALNNIILQARLACDQQVPDAEVIDVLIISWNRALRRIPTTYLEPSLQHAIENHRGIGKITCSAIYQAYRDLIRTRVEDKNRLNAPYSAPPKEYYEMLAKWNIFPKPQERTNENKKQQRQRPQYRIEKKNCRCKCGKTVNVVVVYNDAELCLDCANKEIFLAK